MRFQRATDYAIRILCYLHEHGNHLSTAASLSEKLGISYLYFMKVTGYLKQAGLLKSVQGCNGGYQLAKRAEDISLYDVVRVIEGEIMINRCLEHDGFCSRWATDYCLVHKFFESFQQGMIDELKSKRIPDLCESTKTKSSKAAASIV